MGGGSSSESTDVDNTNNGDTENKNSDETEGDETGDDALRAAPLPDDTEAEAPRSLPTHSLPIMKIATKMLSLPSVPKTIKMYTVMLPLHSMVAASIV